MICPSARWFAAILVYAAAPAWAQDVHYTETHTFEVGAEGQPVVEDVAVSVTFASQRSTDDTRVSVGEQYFNRVTDFQAELDGRRVAQRQFSTSRAAPADVFLSGGTVQSFSLPERPRPGQRLTWHYRRTYPDPAYLPVLDVPNVDRLDRYEIVVRHPASVTATLEVVPTLGDVRPQIVTGERETRAVFEGLAAAPEVPLFDGNGTHASVQIDLRRGAVALTPTQPSELAAWYGRLVASVDTAATPALRAAAEALRRDTPQATVAAIHDRVRQSIRYIADARDAGAFVPRAPDIVLANGYGDCKDRAFLVAALARLVGLRVDVVLAATQPGAATAGVAVGLYNHAICAFGEGAERVYFDPTHPYLPYGDLPEGDVGGRALRLGVSAAEDVRLAAQDSLPTLDVAVRLGLDAPQEGEATVVVRGSALGVVREALVRGAGSDAVNTLSALAGAMLYRIRLSHLTLADDRPDAVTFTGRADLSQFVVASPTRRYLPQTPFQAVPPEARARMADALPLDVPTRPNLRLTLDVAPGAWTAEPADVTWGGPDARFEARVRPTDAGTHVEYVFQQRTRHFAGDARTAYLDFADRYLSARREVFTFRPTPE